VMVMKRVCIYEESGAYLDEWEKLYALNGVWHDTFGARGKNWGSGMNEYRVTRNESAMKTLAS
jgi:hypothetical protein